MVTATVFKGLTVCSAPCRGTLYLSPHFPASWLFVHKALIAIDMHQPSAVKEATAWSVRVWGVCSVQINSYTRTQRIKSSTGEIKHQAHLPRVLAKYKMASAL